MTTVERLIVSAILVVLLCVGQTTASALQTGDQLDQPPDTHRSRPPPPPGVNTTEFGRLWAGDEDVFVEIPNRSTEEAFLNLTDYVFAHPPATVDKWNDWSITAIPRTGVNSAVYMAHSRRTSNGWIRDAHLTVFTVTPSTTAHLAAGDTRRFIRRNGSVRVSSDYRIDLPPDTHDTYSPPSPPPGRSVLIERIVLHRLIRQIPSDVTLSTAGQPIGSVPWANRMSIPFSALPVDTDRLSVSTEVSATIARTIRKKYRRARRVCRRVGNTTRCRTAYSTYWRTSRQYSTRQVTVGDSLTVDVYTLAPRAVEFTFVDGRRAILVNGSRGDPWANVVFPSGDAVHTRWHFYSASDQRWDRIATAGTQGTTWTDSIAVPLEVYAFPSLGGTYMESRNSNPLEVAGTWGPIKPPPDLPASITVPVVTDSFEQTDSVALESEGGLPNVTDMTVHGLVRGVTATPRLTDQRRQVPTGLDITVASINRSRGTVTVGVTLSERTTGTPIDLRGRRGRVVVNGVNTNTDASGTAVVIAPLVSRTIAVRFEPGRWWEQNPAYAPATELETIPTRFPRPIRVASIGFSMLVVLSPFLIILYFLDRLSGRGGLWPPWRRIH